LPSAGPSTSIAPTPKRKKSKGIDTFLELRGSYLPEEEAIPFDFKEAFGMPLEFQAAFGIDDNENGKNAAIQGRAFFGLPDIALRLPEFGDNAAIVDQEQVGTVERSLPLFPADP
jgi:hypothetical protein